jgi:DNA repair protein RecN (Recombination protein N)
LLSDLRIVNLALVERETLRFGPGLNVLTGETGAGKSVIVGSINLALGMRASSDMIRTGADSAYVEATFQVGCDSPPWKLSEKLELTGDNRGEIALAREISRSGKNVCRVNGIRVTLAQLREIGDLLVDIHGQHEHQSLLSRSVQREVLDEYAGAPVVPLLDEVSRLHREYVRLTELKAYLESSERDRAQRADLLRFQVGEIDDAGLVEGEDLSLEDEQRRLENVETLRETYERAYYELYEGVREETGLVSRVELLASDLAKAAHVDRRVQPVLDQFREAVIVLRDLSREFRDLRDACDIDPERLSEVTARLNLLNALKRKYGPSLADVLLYRDGAARELSEIEKSETRLATIDDDIRRVAGDLVERAGALSDIRRAAAERLGELVGKSLTDLAMEHARFSVDVSPRTSEKGFDLGGVRVDIGPHGMDEVEMMFSANIGEPPKPLASVASGGEISRIMLAIKAVLADCDRIPVIVFDEIDVGLGGAAAHAVARKMAQIARSKQIICVTHLPQIASIADEHCSIAKEVADGKTYTVVRHLDPASRAAELARMLDGEVSEISLAHAREMIAAAGGHRREP